MSAIGIPIPIWSLVSASGAPVSGALINAWTPTSAGAPTATRRTLYTDAQLTAPAANPIAAGTSGHKVLYRSPSASVVITVTGPLGTPTYAEVYYPADLTTSGVAAVAPQVVSGSGSRDDLAALTAATGLVDQGLYVTYAPFGIWLYESSDQSARLVNSTKTVSAVDTANDILTVAAHGWFDGEGVIASAADAGLGALDTLYYARRIANGPSLTAGLAIGSTPQNVSNTAFDYWIMGTAYAKGAVAAGTAPGTDVVPINKYGAVAFDINGAGTITAVPAPANATGYTTANLAAAALPAVAADKIRMGYVTASKSDGAFTFGTTSLAAANTTVAYTSSAINQADYLSLHTTRADAFAGTNKVNITALAGSLSLKRLTDPGQGIYVIPDGAALDGSQGAFIRLIDSGDPYHAGWWGMVGDDTGAGSTNTQALYDAWNALPVTTDASQAASPWGGTILLPDGAITLSDVTHILDGKSGRLLGGQGSHIKGTFTSSRAILQSGTALYDGLTTGGSFERGAFRHRFENFAIGEFSIGHGYCIRSYVRGMQFHDVALKGSTISDLRVKNAWLLSGVDRCQFQGGEGRAIHVEGYSNFFDIGHKTRITGYNNGGTEAVLVEGALKVQISHCNIEYNTRHVRVVGASYQGAHGFKMHHNWLEGDNGTAVLIDNTTVELSNVSIRDNLFTGEHNGSYPNSGKVTVGVAGGAGLITSPQIEGNWFAGPTTAALEFLSAADKYVHLSHDYGAKNVFSGGAGISATNRPELETYPLPRSFTASIFGSGSNPAVGNGTLTGEMLWDGAILRTRYFFKAGGTTTFGGGNYSFGLPYNAATLGAATARVMCRCGYILDSGTAEFACEGVIIPATDATVVYLLSAPGTAVAHNAPMTFANGDEIQLVMEYRPSFT